MPNTISIQAQPSKEFFLDMITRDITLTDCILDLIDNSIDSVLRNSKINPMEALFNNKKTSLKKYKINIILNEKEIVIEDNLSGVSEEDAKNNVFRFGSIVERKSSIGLSAYGIGMKRAFLKMGKYIIFESFTKADVVKIIIDVDKWKKDDLNWNFKGETRKNNTGKTGTIITVKKLHESASANFMSPVFKTKLVSRINEVYGVFLLNDLEITVNNLKAKHEIPFIAQSKELKPAIETLERGGVKIKIIAGLSHNDSINYNGWYVFCNGRLILSGDKTYLTGWGDGIRRFHASTNRFVGYVYFESKDVRALPWKTTKDNVDYDSTLYQFALKEMIKKADPIVKFLTKQYTRKKEGAEELQKVLSDSSEISIQELNKQNQDFCPPKFLIKTEQKKTKKISYHVPSADIEKAKELMGDDNVSLEEIGKHSFYYFIKHEE